MSRARDIADQQDNLGGAVAPYVAGKNALINGGMDIWQRGTSFASLTAASSSTFAADRWQVYIGNAGRTVSQQASGLTAFRYSMRVARDSGNTSIAVTQVTQNIESNMSYPLAGKTVTVSFYGKAGANYSAASGALTFALYQGTGIDQNVFGMTGGSNVGTATATLTTSWQRFSFTVAVPSTSTELAVYFLMTPVGTAGANDYFEITGVQLELGSTATPFSRAQGTIQGELAACQRYYWRANSNATYVNALFATSGFVSSTSAAIVNVQFPVEMRTQPTLIDYANLRIQDSSGSTFTISSASTADQTTTCMIAFNVGITGATAFRWCKLIGNSSSSAYLGFGAEL
jgi:hypothetical protein